MKRKTINFSGRVFYKDKITFFSIINVAKSDWVIRMNTLVEEIYAEKHYESEAEAIICLQQLEFSLQRDGFDFRDSYGNIFNLKHIVYFLIKERKEKKAPWQIEISFVNNATLSIPFASFEEVKEEFVKISSEIDYYSFIFFPGFVFFLERILEIEHINKKNDKEKIMKLFFVNNQKKEIVFKNKEELNDFHKKISNPCLPKRNEKT